LTAFAHAPPVPMTCPMQVSHGSPLLAIVPSKQYSLAQADAQAPGLLHAHAWM
jgi:hypothetical protein